MERQKESSKHGLDRFGNMDTPGIEPGASRMLSGCDTTTPCALLAQLDLVDFLVHLLAFHLMIRDKQYRQRFATSCSAEFFTCFSRSLSLSLSLSLYIYIYHYSSLSLSLFSQVYVFTCEHRSCSMLLQKYQEEQSLFSLVGRAPAQ